MFGTQNAFLRNGSGTSRINNVNADVAKLTASLTLTTSIANETRHNGINNGNINNNVNNINIGDNVWSSRS